MSDNGYNRGYSSYNDYYSNNRVENTKFNGKDIIFVSPKQLKEIYAFYLSLGLSTEQAKKLTNRVFNFDVIAHESVAYSINWTFTTNSNYQARTQGASYGYSSYSTAGTIIQIAVTLTPTATARIIIRVVDIPIRTVIAAHIQVEIEGMDIQLLLHTKWMNQGLLIH